MKLILDIETISIASETLEDYKRKFEPAPPQTEPEPIDEEAPKKRKKKATVGVKDDRKKRKSDKPGLNFLTGRIVCTVVKPVGGKPMVFAQEDEDILLLGLYDYLITKRPVELVTFNGRGFDVPFIVMRGLLHGLDFAHLLPTKKYDKLHIDLYEDILGGKWGMGGKLRELAWFFGLEDVEGNGAEVQALYDSGDLEGIISHCVSDVETTEALYRKLLPGRM